METLECPSIQRKGSGARVPVIVGADSWGGRLPLLVPEERDVRPLFDEGVTPPLTPPRAQHPATAGNREQGGWLRQAAFATPGNPWQPMSSDCGSEGRGFEPRRSPSISRIGKPKTRHGKGFRHNQCGLVDTTQVASERFKGAVRIWELVSHHRRLRSAPLGCELTRECWRWGGGSRRSSSFGPPSCTIRRPWAPRW